MRKLLVLGSVTAALAGPCANAADMPVKTLAPASDWTFNPAVTVGYAYGGDYTLSFNALAGLNLGGITRLDLKVPSASGIYVGGELPVRVTDRLTMTLDGRWIFFDTGQTTNEKYNGNSGINRNWDTDSDGWGTLNFLMSYSILKNVGAVKDLAPVVGFRWDHYKLGFNNPSNAVGVSSAAGDTVNFRSNTYAPVFGLAATVAGPRAGQYGGDIKLGVYGSPWIWGDMKSSEIFDNLTTFGFVANSNRGSFITLSSEMTLFSAMIASRRQATLTLAAQYTHFHMHDTALGTEYNSGGSIVGQVNFGYNANPDVFTIGLKGGIAF